MSVENGPRLVIMDALSMPGAPGTVVYDYGIPHPAERGQDGFAWPVCQGIHAVLSGVVSDARSEQAAPPARAGRPPDPGSTTIARTA